MMLNLKEILEEVEKKKEVKLVVCEGWDERCLQAAAEVQEMVKITLLGNPDEINSGKWYFFFDIPVPETTDSSDSYVNIHIYNRSQKGTIEIKNLALYNQRIAIDCTSSNGRFDDTQDIVPASLKVNDVIIPGMINIINNSAAKLIFIPPSHEDIVIKGGGTKTFSAHAKTSQLIKEQPGEHDIVQCFIPYGNSQNPGGFWWNDGNATAMHVGKTAKPQLNGNELLF